MPSVYLYLSTAKLDQLLAQDTSFLAGVTATLDFKLPFVSGGLAGKSSKSSVAQLERLEKKIRREYGPPNHDEIRPGSVPVFVYFRGRAVRAIQGSEFWLALDHELTPLLLAGSASFALGESAGNRERLFSPSADPVGTFVRAFKESGQKGKDPSVSEAVSYIWKELIANEIRSHANLPTVEGLAIYATSVRAGRGFMYARRPNVKEIVVGTPLYVRQVDEKLSEPKAHALADESRKQFLVQVSAIHNMDRADKNEKKTEALSYRLHCLGYRVEDGSSYGSGFYLSEYRRSGRWDRVFVLYPSGNQDLAERVRSAVEKENFSCETVLIDDVVAQNGERNADLIRDGADVSVLVCSD